MPVPFQLRLPTFTWISGCKTFDAVHASHRQIQRAKITPRKALTFIPQKSCTWPISTCYSLPTVLSHSTANLATLSPSIISLSLSFSIFLDWKLGLFGFIRYVLEAETAFATFRPLFLSLSFAKSDFNRSYSVFSTRTLLDLFIVPRLFVSLVFSFVERAILFERSRKKYLKKKEDRRICSFLFIIEHFKGEKDLLFVFIYLFYFFFYLWEGEGNCKGLVFFSTVKWFTPELFIPFYFDRGETRCRVKFSFFPFFLFFRSFARYRKNFVSLPSLKRISRQVFKREIVSISESLKNIATFLFLFRFEGRFEGNENYPSRSIVINLSNDCLSVFKPLNYAVI